MRTLVTLILAYSLLFTPTSVAQEFIDETAINSQLDSLDRLINTDLAQSIRLIDKLDNQLSQQHNPRLFTRFKTLSCRAYLATSNHQSVVKTYEQTSSFAFVRKYYRYWAELQFCLSSSYSLNGETLKESELIEDFINLSMKIENPWVKVFVNYAKGTFISNQGNDGEGLKLLLDSLAIARQQIKDDNLELELENSIANIYSYIGEGEKAAEFYLSILTKLEKQEQTSNQSVILFNLGTTYNDLNKYQLALNAFNKSILLSQKSGNVPGIAYGNIGLTKTYMAQNLHDKAIERANEAENLFLQLEEKRALASAKMIKAEIFRETEELSKSLTALVEAEVLTTELANPRVTLRLLEEYYKTHAASASFQQAYQYLLKFHELDQLLKDEEKQRFISQQTARHELSEKQRENALLQKENELNALQIAQQNNHWQIIVIAFTAALVVVIVLITLFNKEKRLSTILNSLAKTDELTQLNNRREIMSILEEEMDRSHRHKLPLSVLLFDIDHFKNINDSHGHAVGDTVLKQVADKALEIIRNEDHLGRIGGEEFLVILPMTPKHNAAILAERLRIAIEELEYVDTDDQLQVTISVGISELRKEHKEESLLLQDVDGALYEAKNAGRNRVRIDQGAS